MKRGDTLSSIARLFNTTVAKLRSLNAPNTQSDVAAAIADGRTLDRSQRTSGFRLPPGPRRLRRRSHFCVALVSGVSIAPARQSSIPGIHETRPYAGRGPLALPRPSCSPASGRPRSSASRPSRSRSRSTSRSACRPSRWSACPTRASARAAIASARDPQLGLRVPPHRITVNLAPADVRKAGAAFDLPIALGVLAAPGRRAARRRRRAADRRAVARRRDPAGARRAADRGGRARAAASSAAAAGANAAEAASSSGLRVCAVDRSRSVRAQRPEPRRARVGDRPRPPRAPRRRRLRGRPRPALRAPRSRSPPPAATTC